jgi:hypothetical protein
MLDRLPRQLSLAVVSNGEEGSAESLERAEERADLKRKIG